MAASRPFSAVREPLPRSRKLPFATLAPSSRPTADVDVFNLDDIDSRIAELGLDQYSHRWNVWRTKRAH